MLDNALKNDIQQAYRNVVEKLGLTPRYGQRLMIAEIARTLGDIECDSEGKRVSDSHVCVLEAGTGTGKTLAFLIAGLPIAKAQGKRLIVSTATVALQEQVLNQDLPSLASHSGVAFRYALAKGRGRYVCVARLDQALEGSEPNPTLSLFEQSLQADSSDFNVLATDMAEAYGKGDWEGELGGVIGKTAKYVSEAEALSHVAGYTIVNDVSERAFQSERGGQWTKGKSCDTFGPVGPWVVTPDEVGDPQALALTCDVNGERRQTGSTASMIFGVAHVISYLSQMMRLEPGDVIATGTPPGVGMGMKPPVFLKAGDVMELAVEGLGTQRQEVFAD